MVITNGGGDNRSPIDRLPQRIADRYRASLESGRLRREVQHPQQTRECREVQDHIARQQIAKNYRRAVRQAVTLAVSADADRAAQGRAMLAQLTPPRQPGTVHTVGSGKRQQGYVVGRRGEWRRVPKQQTISG